MAADRGQTKKEKEEKMMSFDEIKPQQTGVFWPLIRGVVDEIQSKSPQTLGWRPEKLMQQLTDGNSRLVIIYENGKCIGFLVFRILINLNKEQVLQIWLGGLFSNYRQGLMKLRGVMAESVRWLQNQYPIDLELTTRRRGWERVLKNILTFRYAVFGRGLL